MSALVSVLIPAYNHGRYVQQTIRSIIKQTWQRLELIIIDDGSTDETWKKILDLRKECEARFTRVIMQTQKNKGTCITLNRLFSLAEGDYVFLIASDDIAFPEIIATELAVLENNPNYVLVVVDNDFIYAEGQHCFWDIEQHCTLDKNRAVFLTFGQAIADGQPFALDSDEFGRYRNIEYINHVPNGYLIRASVLKRIARFTPKAPLEDYWLMLQLSKFGLMKFLPIVLFQYRWHDRNQASQVTRMHKMTEQTLQYEHEYCAKHFSETWLPEVRSFIRTSKGRCFQGRRKLEVRFARRVKGGIYPVRNVLNPWIELALLLFLRLVVGKGQLVAYTTVWQCIAWCYHQRK